MQVEKLNIYDILNPYFVQHSDKNLFILPVRLGQPEFNFSKLDQN